jgi:hypothetical protein
LYIVWDLLTVTYLVHLACHGVDAAQSAAHRRYPSRSFTDEFRGAALGLSATIAVLLAAYCLVKAFGRPAGHLARNRRALTSAFVLLAGATAFCGWFYAREYPRISPDLAGAGVSGTWFQLLGGAVLAAMAVAYASYRAAQAPAGAEMQFAGMKATSGLESVFTTLLLIAAALVFFVQQIRALVSVTGPTLSASISESLAYTLLIPDTYFMFGITVLTIQASWAACRQRKKPTLPVSAIDGRRFFAALLAWSLLTVVAVPTLLAAVLSFWLGPWYY